MRVKKSPVILLELLIALSLTGALLSILLSSYISLSKVENVLYRQKKEAIEKSIFFSRMQKIVLSIPKAIDHASIYPGMYTQGPVGQETLYFLFDAGISPTPAFSGAVWASLQLDKEKQIVLYSWPIEKNSKKMRKEILLKGASDLSIAYFIQEGKSGYWTHRMDAQTVEQKLPVMMRISYKKKGVVHAFVCFFPKPHLAYFS